MSHSGSIPSKLVFLSDLPDLKDRDKVRLLGCVEHYDIKSGQLLLKHDYPRSGPIITASVDISLVRETLKNTVLQVGAWVNVVGYVMNEKPIAKAGARDEGGSNVTAKVQAIMLWDTLTVNLEEYEQAVQARKGAGTTG